MWSSQQFRKLAQEQGMDEPTIRSVIAQVKATVAPPLRLPAILTLGHLAQRSGVSYDALRRLVAGTQHHSYRQFKIRKKSEQARKRRSFRIIHIPCPPLFEVQRWISTYVLRELPVHPSSHAFSPGSSIVKCAEIHCKARWLVKLDVHDFFSSVSEIQVYRVFRSLNYGALISFEMARLCTYRPNRETFKLALPGRFRVPSGIVRHPGRGIKSYSHKYVGYLPQGAPTSPMLANLAMKDIDVAISKIASDHGLRYTRYSDDLTFSTEGDFSRGKALNVIQEVAKKLIVHGLMLNNPKTTVAPPSARKIVLGLLVDGADPRLMKSFKDKVRQHLYFCGKYGVEEHAARRKFDSVGGFVRHLRGLIDFGNMVEPCWAADMYDQMSKVLGSNKFDL